MAVISANSCRGLRWFNIAAEHNWLAVLCFIWLVLQMPLWWLPPHDDALGHIFPQAWMLFREPWNLHAIATMHAAEHPPLLPGIIMIGWKVLGINLVWPHLVVSLLGMVTIIGTYKLGLTILDKRNALAAAICMGTGSVFFAQATNPYLEIPVTAGLVWVLCNLISRNHVLLAISVAFMTLSKETSFPLIVPIAAYIILAGNERFGKNQAKLLASILVGSIPALAWIAFAWVEKGALFADSVSAATTNGSTPTGVYELVRKLALGPIQIGVMGLWVPLAAIVCFLICTGPRRYLHQRLTLSTSRSRILLFLGVALTSIAIHAFISIGLNRYYLPILPVLWVMAWRLLPVSSPMIRIAVISVGLVWSLFCYFHGMRYADTEDRYEAIRYVSAHVKVDQNLDRLGASGVVLTSYPSTTELSLPCAGYVSRPYSVLEVVTTSDNDLQNVRWAVVGTKGMHYDKVLPHLTGRNISVVDRRVQGSEEVVLYAVE